MNPMAWLAICSTLLAVSTFVTGQFFQLRTVNLYKYHDYCLTFFSLHEQTQPRAAKKYADEISGYKKTADKTYCAFWISAAGTVSFLIGWLASISYVSCQQCSCPPYMMFCFVIVGIILACLSVGMLLCYHQSCLFKNPEADPEITETLKGYGVILKNNKK